MRMERIDIRASWQFALRTFSLARAALTSVSSVFNRFWSRSKWSTKGSLEEEPGTGGKGVWGPYFESACSPLTNWNPHPVRVLLPISSIIYTPTFFCREIPKCSNARVSKKPYPRSCSLEVFAILEIWRIMIAGRLICFPLSIRSAKH